MIERSEWLHLIPHQGRMALVDRVLHFDNEGLDAESDNHRDPSHPLRRDGVLRAVHLCEYGAQAMAVHGALVARASGATALPGLLVALRAVELAVERIDHLPGTLQIQAVRVTTDSSAWLYRFSVRHEGEELARGQAMVMLDNGDT
ncbi:phosphotransferase [Pseudofulvimonas gallinarii]|jgi:predicted hotdog family 3-hydroxylacyl-ACP dehydratase|uniref:Putative hotdog family 3-hydroxylacyl-ACP dehydratase n=1 Tax=Pseudofulvimonas gallinarii TaxID=634155 RepID=A0A4R3LJC4_9GAMM|nr:phosphotransferase [Pseudofulvimonas gallinarii]TCT00273.1 putative hotdog family 3-hydroxylacyl-ACP dehydratase [Pseudofulvimonas gallinarii]THD14116.1 phosphotransferase [Pseudofulvimonas gallinarii]